MPDDRQYTAEEFAAERDRFDWGPEDNRTNEIVWAALRIAERVMTPGVIEKLLDDLYDGLGDDDSTSRDAHAIRASLTKTKETP